MSDFPRCTPISSSLNYLDAMKRKALAMDMEARAHSEHPEALRLWLRLLTCTQIVEKQVRGMLRERFDTTLPRFDLMAQLERDPSGLKMKDLSRRTMNSGGNLTAITP